MSTALYATTAAYAAYLGLESAELTAAQEAELLDASRTWDRLCNVPAGYFAADGEASPLLFTANDPLELWTGAFHSIEDLTVELDIDGDRVFEVELDPDRDYQVLPADGPPYRRIAIDPALGTYAFPLGLNRVRVTAPWGYSAAAPADISRIALIIAKRYSVRPNTPEGIQSSGEHMMRLAANDPEVVALLEGGRYYRPTLMAGMGRA